MPASKFNMGSNTVEKAIQGVFAIRGLEFRGFAIRGFLKPSKSPHFAITPSFLELKMLKNGYFFE